MYKYFSILLVVVALSACSNEEKESDKLLSDYKNQQLDKARQIEEDMQKRVDNLDKQLKDATENKEDDQPN